MSVKTLSKLVVDGGFVYGWAHDALRDLLTIDCYVDNVLCATGKTGAPVSSLNFSDSPAPGKLNGYCIPLPSVALDGFEHVLTVKVREWRPMQSAPQAQIRWHHGAVFGEYTTTSSGNYEGWVGFRQLQLNGVLPHLIVRTVSNLAPTTAYLLTPGASRPGCLCVGYFKIPATALALTFASEPELLCLGVALRAGARRAEFKLTGLIESVDYEGIQGWGFNSYDLTESLDFILQVDGASLRTFRPNVRRENIAKHLGLLPQELGIVGFHLSLPVELKDGRTHTISVICKRNGAALGAPLQYQHPGEGLTLEQAQRWSADQRALSSSPVPRLEGTAGDKRLQVGTRQAHKYSGRHPVISLVVLNRNGAACLENLFDSFYQFNTFDACEFVVIDHASGDASLAIVKKWQHFLPIELVVLDVNDSFSASCNRGAKMARGRLVLFVNNDIIWQQDILPSLVAAMQTEDVGIVGVKLLKTNVGSDEPSCELSRAAINASIQHLGVRFTLVGTRYWPYEASLDQGVAESVFGPQEVGVVTGALMLCRTAEFLELGGFDERYFYGYEDVEFCLRLRENKKKRVICHNDLVALHHHGYTRLTGREPDVFDHQAINQELLLEHAGLWVQRAWWNSLVRADRLLCAEQLTIGFTFEACDKISANGALDQLTYALALGQQLQSLYPRARLCYLPSTGPWHDVGHLHVLVACSPRYDMRLTKHSRADLRSAAMAVGRADLALWRQNPSLQSFDVLLASPDIADSDVSPSVTRGGGYEGSMASDVPPMLDRSTHKAPLAKLLTVGLLRVQIHQTAATGQRAAADQASLLLTQVLRTLGVLVCHTGPGELTDAPRVVDVVVTVYSDADDDGVPMGAAEASRRKPSFDGPVPVLRRPAAINVLWLPEHGPVSVKSAQQWPDEVWLGPGVDVPHSLATHPNVCRTTLHATALKRHIRKLYRSVEVRVGRAFHSS